MASLSNALTLFDYANEMKIAQREAQNEQWDFETSIIEEDRARINELIEIFGYPYDADIGVNGTYPDGLRRARHLQLQPAGAHRADRLRDALQRGSRSTRGVPRRDETSWSSSTRPWTAWATSSTDADGLHLRAADSRLQGCLQVDDAHARRWSIDYTVGVGLDAGCGRYLPESWPEGTTRARPGARSRTSCGGSMTPGSSTRRADHWPTRTRSRTLEEQ